MRVLASETYRALLHRHGLRATPLRLATLDLVGSSSRPPSLSDLHAIAPPAAGSRASLGRCLAELSWRGILRRTDLGDHVWRYTLAGVAGGSLAPWFTCTRCEYTALLPAGTVLVRARTLQAAVTQVNLRGLCDPCAKTQHRA